MSTPPIQPQSKNFWTGYVKTAQDEAARFLDANSDESLRKDIVSRQRETKNYTLAVQQAIKSIGQQNTDDTLATLSKILHLKQNLYALVDCQIQIDNLNTRKIKNYFRSAIGFLLGGGTLMIGNFTRTSWIVTAGYITMSVSAIFAALNLRLHWSDPEKIKRYYQDIAGDSRNQGIADRILNRLLEFDEQMKVRPDGSAHST